MELSEPEVAVYEFICNRIKETSLPPTYREIAEGCFIARTNVARYLDRLELRGYIRRTPNKARGIMLTDKKLGL